MILIVDYGVGNLFSLKSSFDAIGVKAAVSGDPDAVARADRILLPGVGAFADAADKLRATGMDGALREAVSAGTPLLGICLGMQLLFEKSFEYGEHAGLGFVPGTVRALADKTPPGLKIPQMGWNSLTVLRDCPLLRRSKTGDYVYFVHSYYAAECEPYVTSVTDYGFPVTATVRKDNVFGCQFHPEKSGAAGLKILRAFSETE